MRDCGRTLAVRFEGSGETRELWFEVRGGWLTLGEDTSGSTTWAVYGEGWHRTSLSLSPEAVERSGLGAQDGLGAFFSGEEVQLADLMDALDAAGVPYALVSTGESGTSSFRPAPVCASL